MKFLIILFLLYANRGSCQIKIKGLCEITFITKDLNIKRDEATLEIYKTQPDSVQKKVLIKTIKGVKKQFKVAFKVNHPFNGFFLLKYFDTLYDRSSDLLFFNEIINCTINKNGEFLIKSKQNDFYNENIFLLFDPPNSLAKQRGFLLNPMQRQTELNPMDSFMLQIKIKEYERNVLKEVIANKNYIQTIRKLWDNKKFLSFATLQKGFSILYPIHKNTSWANQLKTYIEQTEKLIIGKEAPSFKVFNQKDIEIKSDSFYSKYDYTLLDFWASWCTPCRIKMKSLREIYSDIDTSKLQIISISIDENKDNWITAMVHDSITWKSYIDPKGGGQSSVGKLFNLAYIPRNFLIDKAGKIIQMDIWDDSLIIFLKNKSLLKN